MHFYDKSLESTDFLENFRQKKHSFRIENGSFLVLKIDLSFYMRKRVKREMFMMILRMDGKTKSDCSPSTVYVTNYYDFQAIAF